MPLLVPNIDTTNTYLITIAEGPETPTVVPPTNPITLWANLVSSRFSTSMLYSTVSKSQDSEIPTVIQPTNPITIWANLVSGRPSVPPPVYVYATISGEGGIIFY